MSLRTSQSTADDCHRKQRRKRHRELRRLEGDYAEEREGRGGAALNLTNGIRESMILRYGEGCFDEWLHKRYGRIP